MSITIFALNLKNRRQALGLSQSELAKRTGQKRQYIWGWENGKSLPTADKLPALADALGVSVDDLLRAQISA